MNVAIALLLTVTSGCGTMANLAGNESLPLWGVNAGPHRPPMPFGGLANDYCKLGKGWEMLWPELREPRAPEGTLAAFLQDYGGTPGLLLDMPFSLAGDIVTLPLTTYTYIRASQNPTDQTSSQNPPKNPEYPVAR
jgi:uncharacterized protein YceK